MLKTIKMRWKIQKVRILGLKNQRIYLIRWFGRSEEESVKKNTRFDESFIEPKKLFEKTETKKKINKSFELDKESCKKYRMEKEPKNVKKVNLTSFLRENKTNSYLLNYITKKN